MPSTKPKIFAYLPQPLYNQVVSLKTKRGLTSDSQALIAILSEYFGSEIVNKAKSNNAIERLEILLNQYQIKAESLFRECDQRINQLEVRFNLERKTNPAYTIEVPANAVEETIGSVPGTLKETIGSSPSTLKETIGSVPGTLKETIGSVPGTLKETTGSSPSTLNETTGSSPSTLNETTGSSPSTLESEVDLSQGLSQRALSKRLGCNHTSISRWEKKGNLKEQSRSLDPQSLLWELRGEKYYPVLDDQEDESTGESEIFIIVEYDKDTKTYRYWTGPTNGFSSSLHLASRYKSEETATKAMDKIAKTPENQYFKEESERFELSYKPLEFLSSNRLWQIRQLA